MPTASIIKSPVASGYQSILDVFMLQGLINYQDYQTIKNKYKSDVEIEKFLLQNKLISADSINRAYSIILKMPFVDLKNYLVLDEAKKIVSDKFIESNLIAPFALKNQILSVAIAKPSRLSEQVPLIEKQFESKVKGVNLFITSPSDIESVLKQRRGQDQGTLLSRAKYPTVFLKNQNIPKELLNLLPASYIAEYHLIIFNKRDDFNYLVATDRVDNPETLKAIKAVEEQNNINFELFATSSDDVAYLINLIGTKDKSKPPETKAAANQPGKDADLPGIFQNFKEMFSGRSQNGQITVDTVEKSKNTTFPVQHDRDQDSVLNGRNLAGSESKKTGEPEPKNETKPTETEDIKQVAAAGDQDESKTETDSAALLTEKAQNIGELLKNDVTSTEELQSILKESQVPKMVAAMISYALYLKSSDIHMEPEEKTLRIRFRVDGILRDVVTLPISIQPQIVSRVKILSNLKLDESRVPQDGRFGVNFNDRQVDIRVSTLPTVRGEKIELRLLDKSQGILSLEDLGMVGRAFELTTEAIKKPYGIIISTGPTGSGKSTTLYAVLNRISVPAVNIVTLEDPVEYEIPGINQCQIKPKIGFSFADGLRSILRQDPNVIMVGEVRDLETANMATHAALTGHLVLTTLHTNDAASSLPRLINMGVEPFLITSSISLIIAQRLVRRVCPKCREEIKIPENLKKQIEEEISRIPRDDKDDLARIREPYKFYQGRGCNECSQGYRGRLGIYEVLTVSDKLEELVIKKSPSTEIANQAIAEGMITMRQDGILKALEGLTTLDEVFRVTATF